MYLHLCTGSDRQGAGHIEAVLLHCPGQDVELRQRAGDSLYSAETVLKLFGCDMVVNSDQLGRSVE